MINVGKYTSPTGMGMMCKYFIVTNILRSTNTIPKLKRPAKFLQHESPFLVHKIGMILS